jgi:hypothetical protein
MTRFVSGTATKNKTTKNTMREIIILAMKFNIVFFMLSLLFAHGMLKSFQQLLDLFIMFQLK